MLTELSAVLNILPGDSLIPGESHSTLVTEQTSLMFALPARTALTPRSSAGARCAPRSDMQTGQRCNSIPTAGNNSDYCRALPGPALHCIIHD